MAEIEAVCQALDWCVVAPICRVARILSAFAAVITHRGREVTRPVRVVAGASRACVAVVAHDALAEVLSAHAEYTNAGKAIQGTVRSIFHRTTPTLRSAPPTIANTICPSAFVAVVRAHDV